MDPNERWTFPTARPGAKTSSPLALEDAPGGGDGDWEDYYLK